MARLHKKQPVSSTRKRIDARRRTRQQAAPPPPAASSDSRRSAPPRQHATPLPTGASGLRTFEARRKLQASMQAARSSLHQIRASAHTRMRRQPPTRAGSSQVQPGVRRTLLHWITSGRLFSLGLFVAATACLCYLFIAPDFQVQQVDVAGNAVLEDHVVTDMAQLDDLWIWFVDKEAIATQVRQNAYVEQAAVELALPNRAIVHISERRPEVRWQAGGTEYLVDGSGRVLDAATATNDGTLVIVDTSNPTLQPNQYVDPDALKLAQALAVRLPNEMQFAPQMIGWDAVLGVYIISPFNQTIVFGRSDNLEHKLAILHQLLRDDVHFAHLDLRHRYPYYRP